MTPDTAFTNSSNETVRLRRHSGWNIHVLDDKENGDNDRERKNGNSFSYLPPRPTAWIILLHDLIWIWNNNLITVNLVDRLIQRLVPAPDKNLVWSDPGWAWYQRQAVTGDEKEPAKWIHFPFPDLKTFRRLDRFLSVWNYLLEKSASGSLQPGEVVHNWICAGWIATGPDERYNSNFLTNAAGVSEVEVNSIDGEQSLEEFKKRMFRMYPQFEQFATSG